MKPKSPSLILSLTAAMCLAWPQSSQAQTRPHSTGQTAAALRQFQQGLSKLAQPQYAVRQAGSAELRQALARLTTRMIRGGGPEQQARIDHLLRYQEDLTRWARALLHLPLQQRLKMLQWGIRPKLLPLVAGAFSHHPQRRADVAHPLAKIPGRNADWLLNRLLRDPHRLVYLTTMDALWNRQPTPAMVKSVLSRAVILGFGGQQTLQHMVIFHGQKIPIFTYVNNYWIQVQYGQYATELLMHWKSANLSHLLVNLLDQMCRQPPMESLFNTPYTMPAKDFAKLLPLAKPADVEPYLLFLIHRPISQNLVFNFNNKPGYISNRTMPLYLLIKLAGKNPANYHLFHTSYYSGTWAVGTAQQENAAIKQITAWYARRKITAWTPTPPHKPLQPLRK